MIRVALAVIVVLAMVAMASCFWPPQAQAQYWPPQGRSRVHSIIMSLSLGDLPQDHILDILNILTSLDILTILSCWSVFWMPSSRSLTS